MNHQHPRGRHLAVLGLAAACAGLLILSAAFAVQQASQGGRALDANLRLGSGGYNRPTGRSAFNNRRYTVGSSRPLYVVDARGEMRYQPHNAFNPNSRYTATGYRGNYRTSSSFRRFRYR